MSAKRARAATTCESVVQQLQSSSRFLTAVCDVVVTCRAGPSIHDAGDYGTQPDTLSGSGSDSDSGLDVDPHEFNRKQTNLGYTIRHAIFT
jgi:hypothetical protein